MRITILLALFWLSPGLAHARGNQTEVIEVLSSSITFNTVHVSSNPTQIDTADIRMADRVLAGVQNLSSTAEIYCKEKPAGLSVGHGWWAQSGGGALVLSAVSGGPNGILTLYCVSSEAGGSDVELLQGG